LSNLIPEEWINLDYKARQGPTKSSHKNTQNVQDDRWFYATAQYRWKSINASEQQEANNRLT
jgi:hypothetical protein